MLDEKAILRGATLQMRDVGGLVMTGEEGMPELVTTGDGEMVELMKGEPLLKSICSTRVPSPGYAKYTRCQ